MQPEHGWNTVDKRHHGDGFAQLLVHVHSLLHPLLPFASLSHFLIKSSISSNPLNFHIYIVFTLDLSGVQLPVPESPARAPSKCCCERKISG